MNVERGKFEPEEEPEEPTEWDRRIEAAIEQARRDPRYAGSFAPDSEADLAASIARARADVEAGRVYDHAVVARWLKTWGTPDRKPFHEWLAQTER